MAIDRIGKGAGLPQQAPEISGTGAPAPGAAPFEVARPDTASAVEGADRTDRAGRAGTVEQAGGPTPLERLRAGEVDVDGYVDLEVDRATSSLKGLSAAELDEIKSVLRDQMKTDPGLADLVRTATGKMPTPPEDG